MPVHPLERWLHSLWSEPCQERKGVRPGPHDPLDPLNRPRRSQKAPSPWAPVGSPGLWVRTMSKQPPSDVFAHPPAQRASGRSRQTPWRLAGPSGTGVVAGPGACDTLPPPGGAGACGVERARGVSGTTRGPEREGRAPIQRSPVHWIVIVSSVRPQPPVPQSGHGGGEWQPPLQIR